MVYANCWDSSQADIMKSKLYLGFGIIKHLQDLLNCRIIIDLSFRKISAGGKLEDFLDTRADCRNIIPRLHKNKFQLITSLHDTCKSSWMIEELNNLLFNLEIYLLYRAFITSQIFIPMIKLCKMELQPCLDYGCYLFLCHFCSPRGLGYYSLLSYHGVELFIKEKIN